MDIDIFKKNIISFRRKTDGNVIKYCFKLVFNNFQKN